MARVRTGKFSFKITIVLVALVTGLFALNPGIHAAEHQTGLLWKIEKKGLEHSYLFATIHLNNEKVKKLAPPVESAFKNSKSFTMEMITDTNGLAVMGKLMFLDTGQSLREIAGKELYEDIKHVLLKRNMTTENLDKVKPWVVIMMLSTPKSKEGLFLDMDLYMRATMARKPRYGLETMSEQLVPFNDMTLKDQVLLLKDSLAALKDFDEQLEILTRAYLKRDLTEILDISEAYQGQAGAAYKTLMDQLIRDRNLRMRDRMQPRLKEGNAFIAVGALHLPGENGLIRLLEKQGYKLTPVY